MQTSNKHLKKKKVHDLCNIYNRVNLAVSLRRKKEKKKKEFLQMKYPLLFYLFSIYQNIWSQGDETDCYP